MSVIIVEIGGIYVIFIFANIDNNIIYGFSRTVWAADRTLVPVIYEGRRNDILDQRTMVKARTMTQRKIHNLQLAG